MPRSYFNKFNRGEVDENVMARDDVERIANSAAFMENWMPLRVGPMMYRPGTEYLGAAKVNGSHYLIPFVDDGENPAFIELSQSTANPSVESVRFWVNDELTQTVATTDTITNGTFVSDISGWTADHGGAGAAIWEAANGRLQITGGASDGDWGRVYQTVTRSAGVRSIRIINSTTPILVQIGTGGTQSNDIFEDVLGLGIHILTIEPASDYTITLANDKPYRALVAEVDHLGAGVLELVGPIVRDTTTLAQTLQTVRYAQVNDVCFVTDGAYDTEGWSYPYWMIKRRGLQSWSFELPEQIDGPFGFVNISSTTLTPGALIGDTTLTASNDFFVDSDTNNRDLYQIDHAGVKGVCEVETVTSPTVAVVRVLKDFGATTASSDWNKSELTKSSPGPTSAEIFEGRFWLAGGARLWGSVSDQYTSFDTALPGDSAAISKTLGFGPVQDVAWLKGGDVMIMGLSSEEIEINSNGDQDAMSASNIRTRRGTNKGAAKIRPEVVDKVIYFVQRGLKKVFALSGLQGENSQANDTTLLHPEITSPGVKRMVYSSEPEPRMYVLLTDGELRVLLFDDTEEVIAWSRFKPAGGGTVIDIAASPSTTEDSVMFLVDRGGVTYVEKLAKFSLSLGGLDSRHYDSHRKYTSPGATITDLQHLEGERVYVWADGVEKQSAIVSGGAITLEQATWTEVVVGIRHVARWRSNKIARYVSESVLNYRKRIVQIGMVMRSVALRTIKYGPDEDHLDSIPEVDGGRAREPTTVAEPSIVDSITGDLPVQDLALQGDVLYAATSTVATGADAYSFERTEYYGGKLYQVGGTEPSPSASAEFWSRDKTTDELVRLTDLPNAVTNHGTCEHAGVIYVISAGYFQAYDIVTAMWLTLSQPTDRLPGMQMAAYNGVIYQYGGDDGVANPVRSTSTWQIYTIGTDTWSYTAYTTLLDRNRSSNDSGTIEPKRYHSMAAPQSGEGAGSVFIYGGNGALHAGTTDRPTQTLWEYNIAANTMTEIFSNMNIAADRPGAYLPTASERDPRGLYIGEFPALSEQPPATTFNTYTGVEPLYGQRPNEGGGMVSGNDGYLYVMGGRQWDEDSPPPLYSWAGDEPYGYQSLHRFKIGPRIPFNFLGHQSTDPDAEKRGMRLAFDSTNNKIVAVYKDYDNLADGGTYDFLQRGVVVVGDVSGTSVTWGTPVPFTVGRAVDESLDVMYLASEGRVVITWQDADDPVNVGHIQFATGVISGTSISVVTTLGFYTANGAKSSQSLVHFPDAGGDKVVACWEDSVVLNNVSYAGQVRVGRWFGGQISWGPLTTFNAFGTRNIKAVFDSSNSKVVITYIDENNSNYGTAIVGTVNPTTNTISMGTPVVFNSKNIAAGASDYYYQVATFDSTSNKVIIAYIDGYSVVDAYNGTSYGTAIVGTVSGTDISFGTPAVWNPHPMGVSGTITYRQPFTIVHDPFSNKVIIAFNSTSEVYSYMRWGKVVQGTVSGTDIVFGGTEMFCPPITTDARYSGAEWISSVFDSNSNKVVLAYKWMGAEPNGFFGDTFNQMSEVVVLGDTTNFVGTRYWENIDLLIDQGGADPYGRENFGMAYDYDAGRIYIHGGENTVPEYLPVFPNSGTLTGKWATDGQYGYPAPQYISTVFDPVNNKMIVVARVGTTPKGLVWVGEIVGDAYTFGTPVPFTVSTPSYVSTVFDSNSNKVVIVFRDSGNSNYGTAIVGTVSGTTMTFGTPAAFTSGTFTRNSVAFDSVNNKVIIAYQDGGNSGYGTAIVGTVSGTDISFGTPAVFNSADTWYPSAAFDSFNNKIVIAYEDQGNSTFGTAIVGTVSGTDISFGTPAAFTSVSVYSGTFYGFGATFDSVNNKAVFAYRDNNNPNDAGTAIVGTVSGTDISFGTPVLFCNGKAQYLSMGFDPVTGKVIIAYEDRNAEIGWGRFESSPAVILGTVAGTDISFGTPSRQLNTLVQNRNVIIEPVYVSSAVDSLAGKVLVSFRWSLDSSGVSVPFDIADIIALPDQVPVLADAPAPGSLADTWYWDTAGEAWTRTSETWYPSVGAFRAIDVSPYDAMTDLSALNLSSADDALRGFGIIADGNYAYLVVREDDLDPLSARERGVAVVDITVPASPIQVAYLSSSSVAGGVNPARAIAKQGDHLFVPAHHLAGELAVIDVSNPAAPTLEANSLALTYTTNPPQPDRISLYNNYLYVAWEGDLHIVDVSDPTSVSLDNVTAIGSNHTQCLVDGVWLYLLAPDTGTVSAYDLTVATAPTLVGTVTSAALIGSEDMTAFSPWLYVVGGTTGSVVDFRDPTGPTVFATYTGFVGINAIAATQPNLFFAGGDDGAGDGTVYSADQRSWLYVDYDEMSFVFNGTYDTDARAYLEATGPATILAMTMEIEDIDEPNSGSDAVGDYDYNQRTSRYNAPQE